MRWRRDVRHTFRAEGWPASVLAAVLALGAIVPSVAAADEKRIDLARADEDTTYGRIEGDISIATGAGITLAPRAPRGTLDVRGRYLDTAGVFVTYEDGSVFGVESEPTRAIATGFEFRPLFLGRWLRGWESGVSRVDLILDSLGFELGAVFVQPQGRGFGAQSGIQLGLGLEIPILSKASGPWVSFHGGVRISNPVLGGAFVGGPSDQAAFLGITLAWHHFFEGHVVDFGDRAPE